MSQNPSEPILSKRQMERYSRQIILGEVGVEGQRRLLEAKVLVVGAGGLGSPVAVYLAAAGVGTLGIIDGDRVDRSNLQRQILHFDQDVGTPKTRSAAAHLRALNPDVHVVEYPETLASENAMGIVEGYDLVVNGCDNFPTRYLINDVCVFQDKPLVDGAILRFEGQVAVFAPGHGCYRCLFPSPPEPGTVPDCATAGVLGALAGHIGTRQAIEALKILLGLTPFTNRLLLYDALEGEYRTMKWTPNPECPVCGDNPSITEPIDYHGFCGVPHPHQETRVPEAVDPSRAHRLIQDDSDVQLVDVRETHEFERFRIPGSVSIPLSAFEGRVDELDRRKPVIVVCAVGQKSAIAADLLRARGFKAVANLEGGLMDWLNHRLPVEES